MKKLLAVVLLLLVAVVALGYSRGWFTVTKGDGQVTVAADSEKFKHDKAAFSKKVVEEARALKDKVASLRKQSEGLKGDDKANAAKELGELETRHAQLEKQIAELDEAGEHKFEGIKQELSKNLKEVEERIQELTKKLEQGKDKEKDKTK